MEFSKNLTLLITRVCHFWEIHLPISLPFKVKSHSRNANYKTLLPYSERESFMGFSFRESVLCITFCRFNIIIFADAHDHI